MREILKSDTVDVCDRSEGPGGLSMWTLGKFLPNYVMVGTAAVQVCS